jgi:hypothetical protein
MVWGSAPAGWEPAPSERVLSTTLLTRHQETERAKSVPYATLHAATRIASTGACRLRSASVGRAGTGSCQGNVPEGDRLQLGDPALHQGRLVSRAEHRPRCASAIRTAEFRTPDHMQERFARIAESKMLQCYVDLFRYDATKSPYEFMRRGDPGLARYSFRRPSLYVDTPRSMQE